jgi:acetyl-CoA carboxylase alpha subunit
VGGAHLDIEFTAKTFKETVTRNLKTLTAIPVDELLSLRIQKFQQLGVYRE